MYKGEIVKTKSEFKPLFKKGEKFKIIRMNFEDGLMPVEAKSLRTGEVYGFELGELI